MTNPKTQLDGLRASLVESTDGCAVLSVCQAVQDQGGRGFLVGGCVRDALLAVPCKDYDVEVSGLSIDALAVLLSRLGEVDEVGRAFGVLRVAGIDVDFSLPRRDHKAGRGHRGFRVEVGASLDFREAARRRDLTINSMGLDPLSGELLDPHGGMEDLAARRLRATDGRHFCEDPLRGLRVAQFIARMEMQPDRELIELCSGLDLSELPGERLFEEFQKLLLKGTKPSMGLAFLEQTELLRFLPELDALRGVPQDPTRHPEGDVWVHTQMVVDQAALLRSGEVARDQMLMFAALCHHLGKAGTTILEGGRYRFIGYEQAGILPTQTLLARMRAPHALTTRVCTAVQHQLTPALLVGGGASPKAYRRLARELSEAGLTMLELEAVARADYLGRTTADALVGRFEAGDLFVEAAQALDLCEAGLAPVVKGQHLIARGRTPGSGFGPILAACQDDQDETGCEDPEVILDRILPRLPE